MIHVYNYSHKLVSCRALLDTCATANFVSEVIVRRLKIPIRNQPTPVSAIGNLVTMSRGVVRITLQSIHDNFRKELTCLVVPSISEMIPSEPFSRELLKIPANLQLADPDFHIPRAVDLLIGSGATVSLFSVGQINLTKEGHEIYLQKTRLGWVVAGGLTPSAPSKAMCYLSSLESQIAQFWEIEELSRKNLKANEVDECEAHFLKHVTRDSNGRYMVRLPFRETKMRLGDSLFNALKRLKNLEKRFAADVNLKIEYHRIIQEYIQLGHMSRVETVDDDGFYLPHHAVIKEESDTTKVRIVFDASAKSSNGLSLNDLLMIGPVIQDKLISHLLRFRVFQIVIMADLEKMYRQVLIHDSDRRYQRILWRVDEIIQTFQLNTVTFGVSSSPFLAIRAMNRLAEDEREKYPLAAEAIIKHSYVDNFMSGADTVEKARDIRDEVIALLKKGGFNIRQWASNDERMIEDLDTSAIHKKFTAEADRSLKTLGMAWRALDDKLYYTIRSSNNIDRWSKRNVLTEIARIFDPIGLLGPVILMAKRIMQDIWKEGLQWDETLPQSIHMEWSAFVNQLESLNQISIERKILIDVPLDVQVHGFCDASNRGYGACVYVRSRRENGDVLVRLLCSKSRVAPLKTVTILRLELCGALLLTRLYSEVIESVPFTPNKVICWCDSTIVLHWLKTSPHLMKTFVANRISEIQECKTIDAWKHIRSADNPADSLSRGQLPRSFLTNYLWLSGPEWLKEDEVEWPNDILHTIEIPELKKHTALIVSGNDFNILERYSSYSKLIRVIAYCLRFRYQAKQIGPLTINEMKESEIRILKMIQSTRFNDLIKNLKDPNKINFGRLANLNPFIDECGLIRVGGRIQKSNLPFSQRHPILLPNRCKIIDNIIREMHERYYHTGIRTTLYYLRQRFWILDGVNQVRKVVRNCTRCFRFVANPVEYRMGDLPAQRVRESLPFSHTGMDFAGPFYIKEKKYRNQKRLKVYVCIFVCMSVKAVHIEIVSDLSADGVLAALRRFTARRGLPEHLYSDNGTNFVGANNKLKELYVLMNSDEYRAVMNNFTNNYKIYWHFIPPVSPHYGGLWEAAVKVFKHHFKRVVGELLLTFEELNTFVIEVEGILNSRPITTISSDPNDSLVLSPSHFLIGKSLIAFPEGDLSNVPANRLSTWRHITKIKQDFWKRWHMEYLNELQKRTKWINDGPKLVTGTIVLIKDKNQPCLQWAMGKITQVHPGDDGIVRAATIKTMNGNILRSSKCLCPLPNMENSNDCSL